MSDLVKLRIAGNDAVTLKLVWSQGDWSPEPYLIGRESLQAAADAVREYLNLISLELRSAEIAQRKPALAELVSNLADAGSVLSTLIFDPIEGSREVANTAREIIAGLTPQERLLVQSDATVHVPWGFVYRGEPGSFSVSGDKFEDFKDFWLMSRLSVRFINAEFLRPEPRRRENLRVLYAMHMDRLRPALDAWDALGDGCRRKFEKLLKFDIGLATDWNDWRKKWRTISTNDSVLYVFGHANGNTIEIADADEPQYRMRAIDFRAAFAKSDPRSSASICILNGCSTGSGQFDNSFLAVTSRPGFHGFIGTEAEVSNMFAAKFGVEFMRLLCECGLSVQDAFQALRLELFPQSLLYTCFANGSFRIEPEVDYTLEVESGHAECAA